MKSRMISILGRNPEAQNRNIGSVIVDFFLFHMISNLVAGYDL